MSVTYYAFTVKCNSKFATKEELEEWIEHAESKGFRVQTYYFELDKKDRLHMHGVALAPPNLYKKRLLYNNYHQRIDMIPSFLDLQKWVDYIEKDYINSYEYEQMLASYHLRHSGYNFI